MPCAALAIPVISHAMKIAWTARKNHMKMRLRLRGLAGTSATAGVVMVFSDMVVTPLFSR